MADKPERLTPEQLKAQQAKWPPWLQLTPAQQQEDKNLQIQLATAGPMSHLTPEERHLMRALSLQHHARTQLAVAEWHTSPEEVEQAKKTLAEGLAMAGEFREAADLHPDSAHALRFAQIADAIEKPDDERCTCLPSERDTETGKVVLHPRIITERVYSKKHGKLMPLIKCTRDGCGHENVRALGTATAERAAAVTKAMREAHRNA